MNESIKYEKRQIDRRIDRQKDTQIDRQIDRKIDIWQEMQTKEWKKKNVLRPYLM